MKQESSVSPKVQVEGTLKMDTGQNMLKIQNFRARDNFPLYLNS